MKHYMNILIVMTCLFFSYASQAQEVEMDNNKINSLLNQKSAEVYGEMGSWQIVYEDFLLFVLTDEENNRIRIFTPVIEEKDMANGDMHHMLQANFHSALDAKYCTFEGFVISAYTHPLKELSEEQLLDAMTQVARLADTYGTTFTSTNLTFGQESLNENKNNEVKKEDQRKTIVEQLGKKS